MHISLVLLPLLSLSLRAKAQNSNVTGLISALQAAGLTSLATAATRANQSQAGQQLLAALVNGTQNYTVFAPNNAAFSAPAGRALGNNSDTLAAILSYHVLPGNFVNATNTTGASLDSAVFPNVTVGRTLLTNTSLVHLEGNKGQVLVWTRNATANSSVFFLDQSPEITVLSTIAVGGLLVSTISGVLAPPKNLTAVVTANNLTSLAGIAATVSVPDFFSNGTNATITQALEANTTRGFTLFAPNNAALQAAQSSLTSLISNQTALLAILGNHYINGSAEYSPTLLGSSSGSFISASGEPFTFSSNSSGAFVTSGSASAQIVKSDVLVENGVVHVVDRVLVNLDRDETKASSAFQSATSVAGQSATATGPVGPTGSGGANGGGNSNGALGLGLAAGVGSAGFLGALGWVLFVGMFVA